MLAWDILHREKTILSPSSCSGVAQNKHIQDDPASPTLKCLECQFVNASHEKKITNIFHLLPS